MMARTTYVHRPPIMMSVSKLLDSIVVHLHVILVLCLVLLAVSNNFNGDNGDVGKLLLDGRRSSSSSSSSLFVMCFSNSPPLSTSRRSTSSASSSSILLSRDSANRHHAALKGAASSLSSNSHHYFTDYSTTTTSSTALRSATSNSSADINAATSTSTTTNKAKSSSTKKKTTKKVKRSPKKKQQYSQKKGGSSNNSMAAARMYNSQLTKCNSVSELLTSFMEQTSPSGGGSSGGGSSATQSSTSSMMMSSATHMAGATKVNSVNFSTCLHRLARFAAKGSYNSTPSQQQQQQQQSSSNNNNSNNNRSNDARKQVLSDPRFALLVCSMAEMASGCDARISVKDGNELLQQWKRQLGSSGENGNTELLGMGGMKEADDVLNDIVGLDTTTSSNNRDNNHRVSTTTMTTRDRYNTAEQIMNQLSTPQTKNSFSSRECSNVCWALAKLRVAPPYSAFALGRVHDDDDDDDDESASGGGGNKNDFLSSRQFVSLDEMALDVISSTLQVRMQLFDEARKRKSGSSSNGAWIPELSRLAGKVMDLIAVKIILDYGSRNDGGDGGGKEKFNPQEMASVLWAYAKSQRADDALFSIVAAELIRQTEYELGRGGQGPRPQELSNTIWAFATAGIRGEQQIELVKFAADALDEGEGLFFGNAFKPQELANTGWALATLHSKRSEGTSTEIEDDGVVRILRWVAKDIKQRVDAYKPQETLQLRLGIFNSRIWV